MKCMFRSKITAASSREIYKEIKEKLIIKDGKNERGMERESKPFENRW